MGTRDDKSNTDEVKLKSRAGYVQMMLIGNGKRVWAGISKILIIVAAPILAPLQA